MNLIVILVVLAAGVLLGALIGYLYARARMAATAADLVAHARAADERARAAGQHASLVDGHLAERFQAISAQALEASQLRLAELSESRLRTATLSAIGELESRKNAVEQLVAPLRDTLARVEGQLREAESARRESHAALAEQVKTAIAASDQLKAQTQALVTALRRPEARGRWGEMQLRRVAEIAGMSPHCDFSEQVSVPGPSGDGDQGDGLLRPDMVVHLAGDKNIVVDAKVSLAAYLEAAEADDEAEREARLAAHARHLRDHVNRLANKAYWTRLGPAPEFVVLFIPGEAFLAPALERDPGLLEHAMARRVHIATPTTLISLLRTAQYAWQQQQQLSANARAVFDLGNELYERLSVLGGHVQAVGRSLTGAVTAFNKAVGSLEGRVLVTARRLSELGITSGELAAPSAAEVTVRSLTAPEFTAPGLAAEATTRPARSLPGRPVTGMSANGAAQPGSPVPDAPVTATAAGAALPGAAGDGQARVIPPGPAGTVDEPSGSLLAPGNGSRPAGSP